jgi:hypothetical protein
MRKTTYSILLIIALLLCGNVNISAQLDSRNRTVETIIIDNLGQLPAANHEKYAQVMGEIAATGEKGIVQLASMLGPASTTKNAKFEYALNSVTDYVMTPGNQKYLDGVRKGLISALDKCTDNANKAFLMTQLQKCATSNEVGVFEKYLSDKYLQDYAIRGLAATPGIDSEVLNLIKGEKAPKSSLAYLAYFKKLKDAEPVLLNWAKTDTDQKDLASIYNALTTCGSAQSLKYLSGVAKKLNYANDATGATNAFLTLLNCTDNNKVVSSAAKSMLKNPSAAVRCAGLRLLLQSAGSKANATKMVLAALKDGNIEYRNTALDFAKKYAGDDIIKSVASKFNGLSDQAKTDVVRWLGNNHATSEIDLVNSAMNSTNADLAKAAIKSAGQIGGEKALEALIKQLGGSNADAANASLLAFNGSINDDIVKALSSEDASIQAQALKLASARHIHSAYSKVQSLLNTDNAQLKSAAYDALKGVASPSNFDEICNLLDQSTSSTASKLQDAAKAAIAAQSADKQYSLISQRLAKAPKASLYYPLLAQAGNSAAIGKLMQEYKGADKAEAEKALLKVNNPEMINILYDMAKAGGNEKDAILRRYLTLTQKSDNTPEAKYLLYRQALELNPSDNVTKSFISALGNTRCVPALGTVAKYLDNENTKHTAAYAVKELIGKNEALQGGAANKALLNKTKDIFSTYKANGDADAGYAIDEISGILPKFAASGYDKLNATKKYENFELNADVKGEGSVVVRSVPEIKLTADGITFGDKTAKVSKDSWNNLYVKVLNDRIFINVNGNTLVENAILKKIAPTGLVAIKGATTRDVEIKELASTPVFELSPEEKKQGFEVLFDGRSLDKWHGNTTGYVPVDGNIYVTANYGGSGNLYTNKKYSDFIYRFEFYFDVPGVNNGIGIRTKDGVDAAYDGMEIQVLDHDDPIYKGLAPYQQHGSVYGIIVPKHINFGPIKTWHKEEIRAVGDHITVTVDGQVLTDGNIREACKGHNMAPDGSQHNPYTVDHKNHPGLFNKDGYISFCGHGPGVKFRNVRILDLSKNAKAGKAKSKSKRK